MYLLPTVVGATMPVSAPRRSPSSTRSSAIGTTAPDDPYEVLSLVAITWGPNSEAMVEGPRFLRPAREALGVAGVAAARVPPVMLAAALLARVDGR